jgi:hypothetical protein
MGKIMCGELRYGDIAGRALKRLIPGFSNWELGVRSEELGVWQWTDTAKIVH